MAPIRNQQVIVAGAYFLVRFLLGRERVRTLSLGKSINPTGCLSFFRKSIKASSATSWKLLPLYRATTSMASHVSSSNWTRLPTIDLYIVAKSELGHRAYSSAREQCQRYSDDGGAHRLFVWRCREGRRCVFDDSLPVMKAGCQQTAPYSGGNDDGCDTHD